MPVAPQRLLLPRRPSTGKIGLYRRTKRVEDTSHISASCWQWGTTFESTGVVEPSGSPTNNTKEEDHMKPRLVVYSTMALGGLVLGVGDIIWERNSTMARQSRSLALTSTLDNLAERIRQEYQQALSDRDAVYGYATSAMTHALEAGRLLIEAKTQVRHGQWLPFLESVGMPARTAQQYMRLAKNTLTVAQMPVGKALKKLAEPKEPRKRQSAPLVYEVIDPTGFDFMESDARRRSMESPAETEEAEEEAQDEDAAPLNEGAIVACYHSIVTNLNRQDIAVLIEKLRRYIRQGV